MSNELVIVGQQVQVEYPSRRDTAEQFMVRADQLADYLMSNEGDDYTDTAVSADANTYEIVVEIAVKDEENLNAAGLKASSILRTAIHAIGGYTPGWPGDAGRQDDGPRFTQDELKVARDAVDA